MGHNITILKNWSQNWITNLEKNHSYWIWSFYHNWNTVYKFGPFWPNFKFMTAHGLLKFQILEKWRTIEFFTWKIYVVPNLGLFIVVWSRYVALKLLWRIWESDVKKGPSFHTFRQIFYKRFKILVLSYNLFHQFSTKLWPGIRNLLFLCTKELHKKFAPIVIVCQGWRQRKETKTGITFDLDVILRSGKVAQNELKIFLKLEKCSYYKVMHSSLIESCQTSKIELLAKIIYLVD